MLCIYFCDDSIDCWIGILKFIHFLSWSNRLSGLDSQQYSKVNKGSGFSKLLRLSTLVACLFFVAYCTVCAEDTRNLVHSIILFTNHYLYFLWTYFFSICNLLLLFILLLAEAKRQLVAAGFHLLNENEEWDLKPGGRYFFTRNMSSLVAFAIGEKWAKCFLFVIIIPQAPDSYVPQLLDLV